jgi:uncharacterized protein YwqG
MTSVIDDFRNQFSRRAIVMEIGGFRPSDIIAASWFGRVNLGVGGEYWPLQDGQPMMALAQINLTELPFRTPGLEDIDFITVFIGPKLPVLQESNGSHWVLRTYKTLDDLVPLKKPDSFSYIKPFQMRPKVIENDFPCFEDVPLDIRDKLHDAYMADQFDNVGGFKLGGWPTLIQSEIIWDPQEQSPLKAEYVFQIDSSEKANWMWGDCGVGYFGRGTIPGKTDIWVLDWQCY